MSITSDTQTAEGAVSSAPIATSRGPSPDGRRPSAPAAAVAIAKARPEAPEQFAVEVERRGDVAIVQPRGELDVATVQSLQAALDGIRDAARLVLDLRGLSFLDSSGLHLLGVLHQRAQREGFELALIAPPAPVDRAIQLCGLDEVLPFVPAAGAEQGEAAPGPRAGS